MTDWNLIVREHGPRVFATAWRILGHAADTEDVVQEVFLEAHRMTLRGRVRCWPALLRRLAVCRGLDRLRQRKVRGTTGLDGEYLVSPDPGPEETLLERDLAQRLRAALAHLTARESSVFCLRYFEDLSNQQIAKTLNIRPGTVGVALHKARARLGELLQITVPGE